MKLKDYLGVSENAQMRQKIETDNVLSIARDYAEKANPDANPLLDLNAIQGYSIAKNAGLVPHIKGRDL